MRWRSHARCGDMCSSALSAPATGSGGTRADGETPAWEWAGASSAQQKVGRRRWVGTPGRPRPAGSGRRACRRAARTRTAPPTPPWPPHLHRNAATPEGSTGSSMVFFRHRKPPSTMHQTTAAESHARHPPQLPASLKHPLEASTPLALRVCTCHWAVLLVELVDVHLKIGGAWQGRRGDGRNGHMEQCRCQTTACKA
jgi:hypothetical protein